MYLCLLSLLLFILFPLYDLLSVLLYIPTRASSTSPHANTPLLLYLFEAMSFWEMKSSLHSSRTGALARFSS